MVDGLDYNIIRGLQLEFNANVIRSCFDVSTIENEVLEVDKMFNLRLSTTDESVNIDQGQATVTIIDDDGMSRFR